MINHNNVEKLFEVLDASANILFEKCKLPYLEGIVKTCENIVSDSVLSEDEKIDSFLKKQIDCISDIEFKKEEIRKAFQYTCLKGFKQQNINNQMITPESIGFLIGYLLDKLYQKKDLLIIGSISRNWKSACHYLQPKRKQIRSDWCG